MSRPTSWLKGAALDAGLGAYAAFGFWKVGVQQLALGLRSAPFEPWEGAVAAGGALAGLAVFVIWPAASIGRQSLGLAPAAASDRLSRAPWAWVVGAHLALTLVIGLVVTQSSVTEFFSVAGMSGAKRIFVALATPELSIVPDALVAAVETIYMAFIATVFAVPVAFVASFFSARNLTRGNAWMKAVYGATRLGMNLTRSIEPLVWAIVFSVWVGIGPFAGTLALMLHSIASLVKLYSEQIEAIDDGPVEAITATGAGPVQVVAYGVVPQVVLPFLSYTIYRWDINVRMATVIGLVGGGGIGTPLMQYQGLAKWHEVGTLVLVIAVIVWAMDQASARIREHLR